MLDTKVVITDLDGTILPRGGKISEKTTQAFYELGNKGITRVIATGRTLHTVKEVIDKEFPLDYLIFSSGTGILDWKTGKFLNTFHIFQPEARNIADYLWENNINFILQQAIPDNHYFYYTDNYPVHSDYKRRVEKLAEFGTSIANSDEIETDCTQFIIILNPIHLRLIEKLKKDLPHYSIVRSTSPIDNKSIWIEIYPSGVNKGSSLLLLLKRLNISPNKCAGIGNDYNDIDFLNICGKAYMVANAPKNLKPSYSSVKSDKEDGFSDFVNLILK